MNEDVKNLIVLEQLPKIKATLTELSEQVKKDVNNALTLVCTEETVKDVKQEDLIVCNNTKGYLGLAKDFCECDKEL